VELTDPHLPVLSGLWLAALKDKAYLFLPAEFGNQLPPSGGTFYSVGVMDTVKPYYEANWSSLLHAAAIWLEERGFQELGANKEGGRDGDKKNGLPTPLLSGASNSSPLPPPLVTSNPKVMNFHLILGLSVQSLCAPATLDHPHILSSCLWALHKLLSSSMACEVLSSDSRFAMEILSTLHRLLLTCQSPSFHVLSLRIAILVGEVLGKAVQSSVLQASEREGVVADKSPVKELDSDKVIPVSLEAIVDPGKSYTYSLLEVVSCCLLRLVPSLAEHQPRPSSSSAAASPHLPSKDDLMCMSLSLKILAMPCGLCTPEALPSVLPSAVHLLLSMLGYVSTLPQQTIKMVPHLPAVALSALSQVCTTLPMSHDEVGPQLAGVLQSALISVLGGYVSEVKGESTLAINDESRMMVVVVLLRAASSHDICPSALFEGSVALFVKCLRSSDSQVCAAEHSLLIYPRPLLSVLSSLQLPHHKKIIPGQGVWHINVLHMARGRMWCFI
jgi:hypothetical protein